MNCYKREGSGEFLEDLPVPKGACKKAGEGILTRACSDTAQENDFKLKEGRLYKRRKFFIMCQ